MRALSEAGVEAEFSDVRRLIGKGDDKLLPEVAGIGADSRRGQAIAERRGEIFQIPFSRVEPASSRRP